MKTLRYISLMVVSMFLGSVSLADVKAKSAGAQPAPAATKATQTTKPAGLIDINTADQQALESLPGIGAATARAIIAARPFKSVEDLQKIKGIGKAKFESIKDKVTVERAMTVPATRAPAPAVESNKTGTRMTQPAGREPAAAMPAGPININTADQKTLESLPDIGPVKAQAIIAHRPYTKAEDIMKVPGIKEGIFARIKDHIVVK